MYDLLDRYIGKTILYNIFIILFILLSLSGVIKFVDELRKIGQGYYGVLEASYYVFLNILKDIERFLPMAILLGTLLGLGIFLTRNELMVMEIFGFSRLRIVFSLIKIACPIILFGVIINEWAAPLSECIARDYRYKMINNVSICSEYRDLWVKDGYDFIYIEKILQKKNELLGIHIYHFDNLRCLKSFRYAAYAKFVDGFWGLSDVSELCFDDFKKNIKKKQLVNDIWITIVTPDYLSIVVKSIYHSTALSIFDLYRCIQYFRQSGQNTDKYQLYFWRKLFFPVSVIAMMLVALSFIFKSLLYKLHIGVQILIGVIYSFFFIF